MRRKTRRRKRKTRSRKKRTIRTNTRKRRKKISIVNKSVMEKNVITGKKDGRKQCMRIRQKIRVLKSKKRQKKKKMKGKEDD